jgi:hypothetical protein
MLRAGVIMPRLLLFAVAVVSLASATRASAEYTDTPPRPAGSYTTPYPAPGAPPPGTPPAPLRSPYLRRPVELVPELSLSFPHCASGDVSSVRCSGVHGGAGLGFSAFWRVTPYFAWGGGFDLAGFRYDPPEGTVDRRDTRAAAVTLSLLGRVYFFERGSFDPYVAFGIGGGALGTSGRDAQDEGWDETGAGPALSVGGGLDFFLSRRLRLGPSLTWTRVFVDKIRRCTDGACEDLSKADHGHLNSYANLGLRLTIMVGDDL